MLSRFCPLVVLVVSFIATTGAVSQERPQTAQVRPLLRIDAKTPQGLQSILKPSGGPRRRLSGHRGGAQAGYPENCIATFEHTLAHTFALLEIDPRMAKDGAIVVHHDPTLQRTTTGRGPVADFTLAEL